MKLLRKTLNLHVMKDQKTLDEELTPLDRWDRARTLMLESLYKPDNHLRSCSHNQKCYDELMSIRDQVVELVRDMPNPHGEPLPFGKKNTHVEPTVTCLLYTSPSPRDRTRSRMPSSA